MEKTYKQITFFENNKRLTLLENFKLHLGTYLNNLEHHYSGGLSENEKAKAEHKEINKLIDKACSYIEAIPSIVGVIGEDNYLTKGLIYEQDIIDKSHFYKSLIDMTERAIAVYRGNSKMAKQRTYNPFSRITIIKTIESLESLTHAEIGRFLLKFGLEKVAPQKLGSKMSRVNAVIGYLIENHDEKGPFGANLTFEIIEDVLKIIYSNKYSRKIKEHLPELINSLKHDSYIITDEGSLKRMLPESIKLVEREYELNSLLDKFGFTTAKGHIDQAINAHSRGEWASANAQLRSFMESLFDSIADKLACGKMTLPSTGHQRREFLAKLNPPFLIPTLNEWEINGKSGFLQGLWRRLNPQGSHPGLSDEEDSTFRLHLMILTAFYYLKRLDSRTGNP